MSLDSNLQLKFSDHLNSKWIQETCKSVSNSIELEALYSRLISSKEICVNIPHTIHLKGPNIPDFENDAATQDEQEHLINALIHSQTTLAEIVVSSSPFAQNLKKRLAVLQRIYHAVSKTCHLQTVETLDGYNDADSQSGGLSDEEKKDLTGNRALIELGVGTGLSLVFSLLEQNWKLSAQLGTPSLCNDVLNTALGIVTSLQPLSLANDSKLTFLGVKSLNQTSSFLKSACCSTSCADPQARQCVSELMLALAAQRGSLKFLLEWIELAMICSPRASDEKARTENRIRWHFFQEIISKMMKSAVSSK